MSGLNKNRRQDETRRSRPFAALRDFARRFVGDKRANVLIMFGLTLPLLLAIVAGGIDFSLAEGAKTSLQDAADAASLATSAEVVLHPNDTVAQLQAVAAATLAADDTNGAGVKITNFQVCAPVAQSSNCTGMVNNTVLVAVQASAFCIPVPLPTMVCQGNPPAMVVSASTTTVIGFGATLQLNVVMDSSASMIVGSTSADVTTIANWVGATTTITEKCGTPTPKVAIPCRHYTNWNSVAFDPVVDTPTTQATVFKNPDGSTGDNPQCAFACHDEGNSTTAADIQLGLTRATAAGATTRFQVMIQAAQNLIGHVASEANSTTALAKNNYVFNVYSFDDTLHTYGTSANMPCNSTANGGCAAPLNAVNTVVPGLDTYIDNAMTTFAGTGTNSIGANGTGASVASPLKFLLLVTDGLQSDRNKNWQDCTKWGAYAPWSWANACLAGAFANPMNTANCTTLKNEGVVVAVLETPYVPLTGMDPQNAPYEGDVRDQIYPNGPGDTSRVSAALSACATSGYYFQAVNSTDIATGFTQLTDKFLQHSARISQ
jgi:Flp pilus assembly protein TadG